MIIGEGLPFIKDYIASINDAIKQQSPEKCLTTIQSYWLSFVILGMLVTNLTNPLKRSPQGFARKVRNPKSVVAAIRH